MNFIGENSCIHLVIRILWSDFLDFVKYGDDMFLGFSDCQVVVIVQLRAHAGGLWICMLLIIDLEAAFYNNVVMIFVDDSRYVSVGDVVHSCYDPPEFAMVYRDDSDGRFAPPEGFDLVDTRLPCSLLKGCKCRCIV